jgi:cell wall-associated NlpC family hydrolase
MVTLAELKEALLDEQSDGQTIEFQCQANLNLYSSPDLNSLATQAIAGRQLRVLTFPSELSTPAGAGAIYVQLCEDDYPGWVAIEDLDLLTRAEAAYQPVVFSEMEIEQQLPSIVAYARIAMNQPNHYLWGGTVGPNYDCSGLTQTAYAAAGIWIPRDSYQQEAFVQAIAVEDLQPGNLIFFGTRERCNHVALYLGEGCYIHSSGKDQGRNGIGIDRLSEEGDLTSRTYFRQLRGVGKVMGSYIRSGSIISADKER